MDNYWVNQIMNYRRPFIGGADYETRVEGLKVWIDSDVKLTFGTDSGPDTSDLGPVIWGRLGRMHFSRMVGLQDAGMSPMEIIIASTRNPAEAYHLDDEVGTLESGKLADILVLNENPLEDIANMNTIHMVIKSGSVVDREALPTVRVLDYDPEKAWPE
jgi:imidazolonepropionase-like amidohydrolase